ncbi:tyrosine-type recombinase/integrase [Pseudomonas plecoglossicida]|uniref:DUF4102 domain-containing protein n=1 Tax=Pseudomonas plecoglossicida TaxID=70775 RepID=A0AAD0VV67_PSEDL|nr:integrase family protein [Pseudomonas plecoglossicida]AXM97691.1 DUF4102 domain-containing protein [Pseudomonas plecoglossicida]EPB95727.1 phage integrase [Pseudomonas plecoglossicida NB2011]QLB57539.1 tyrosine-type recombinase/integrase [Pseudomonas plecoglossicida]
MLTDSGIKKAIRDAKATGTDVWLTEAGARGEGRLCLRAGKKGASFYFRYAAPDGKQARLPIGSYETLGLKEARAKAGDLSRLYQSGVRDLHAFVAQQRAEQAAAIKAAVAQREKAERQAATGSLDALCTGYVAWLDAQGKQSAKDAKGVLDRCMAASPDLAKRPANDVSHKDIAAMLAKLVEAGKGRAAGKLRSYLHAAYRAALQAEGDPTIPAGLHGFELDKNPVALVAAKGLAKFNKARERVLTEAELKAFLSALDDRPGVQADTLHLLLLLGGQRVIQLLRAKPTDVDLDAGTVTLLDPKGARQQPRVHVVPVTAPAAVILKKYQEGAWCFSTHGRVPLRAETLTMLVADISAKLVKDKVSKEPFRLSDLRRTCETMLARMGISKDVRAQLLSHGIGGVQDRHYDKHDYLDEKRHALEAWAAKLESISSGKPASNVVPLHAGA